MKNIRFGLLLLLIFATKPSFAQDEKPTMLKHIVSAAGNYQNKIWPEKVYLHTDRSYYFTGDTIWFKAYLFNRYNLSASVKSQLLYVELNDDSLTNIKRFTIPIRYGIGWAQIPLLPKQFHEGTYTLRAYTNWMQNTGEDGFFKQRIYIGKPNDGTWLINSAAELVKNDNSEKLAVKLKVSEYNRQPLANHDVLAIIKIKDQPIFDKNLQTSATGDVDFVFDLKDKQRSEDLDLYLMNTQKGEQGKLQSIPLSFKRVQKIDLQFFPEGGNMVAGINGLVAFKAINEDGLGADVSGTIYDSKNNKAAVFKSLHEGMGTFYFTPQAEEKYTARIEEPVDGSVAYPLPKIEPEGTVIHVENRDKDDSLTVKIAFSQNIKTGGVYSLIAESRGAVDYSNSITPQNTELRVAKSVFPTGIAHFSLLKDTIAVNERLVFIDHKDNFKIDLNTDKPYYAAKDSITLNLDVKNTLGFPVDGSFSIAVTDDSKVSADTTGDNGIIPSLLLRSELKGYLEHPSYYFQSADASRHQALDNLLLTQGWVGLTWNDIFKNAPPKYKAELGFALTGKVISAFKRPVEGAQITMSSKKPAIILETTTKKDGTYAFDKLPMLDTASFLIMSRTATGKIMRTGQLTVDKFSPPEVPDMKYPKVKPWYVNIDTLTQKAANTNIARFKDDPSNLRGRVLKEVVIKAKKIIPRSYNINGGGNADMVFDETDIKAAGVINLYDFFKQQIPGFKVIMKDGYTALMLDKYYLTVRIDGVPLQLDVDGPIPTVQQITEALKDNSAADIIGVEVMYSKKYTHDHSSGVTSFSVGKSSRAVLAESAKPFGYDRYKDSDDYIGWRAGLAAKKDADMATIELTSRLHAGQYRNNNGSLNHVTYYPVSTVYPKTFYSPKFVKRDEQPSPDLRSTIFWQPDIITNNSGKAILTFYAGDKPGTYSVNLQGADLTGGIGSGSMKIRIK